MQWLAFIYLFICVLCSSDGENGADERKKTGKSPNIMLHVPASEAEYFDDRKKIGVAR